VSKARRARRIAAAAAYGGGGAGFITIAGVGLLVGQAKLARRAIGRPFGGTGPRINGVYGGGGGTVLELTVLGDSAAAGLGADAPEETLAAIIARGLAAVSGRPVRLTCEAVVGADSSGLEHQLDRLLAQVPAPDATVIIIGANDVTHRIRVPDAIRELVTAVERLREAGAEVVVGTCPDLGTLEPVAQPLRALARRMSRQMAAAQTIAVVSAGGRTVSLGDIIGPEFGIRPGEMFSSDRFHPSSAGYARMAAAMLPSVCAALGFWPDGGSERPPEYQRGEGFAPIAQAAVAAASDPGTEVTQARVTGDVRRPPGKWVMLLRRRRWPVLGAQEPQPQPGAGERDGAEIRSEGEQGHLPTPTPGA